MAASFSTLMIWMSFILLLMFLQGHEATLCKIYTLGYTKYCSSGCCYSNTFNPCCSISYRPTYTYTGYNTSYTRYTGLSTTIYWIIAVSVLVCVGVVIGVIVCCCCRRRQANTAMVINGTPSQVVFSSNNVQTSGMQPGVASPVQQPGYNPQPQPQPGYYPPQPQPGYYPPQPQPGYYPPQPQPDSSAHPPSYETLISGKQTAADADGYEALGNGRDNKGLN